LLSALALAAMFAQPGAAAGQTPVNLGSAAGFAVLAGSAITVTGSTSITGDIGSYPTPAITGLENVVLKGVNQAGDAVTQTAKNDLVSAYTNAAGRPPTKSYDPISDLGGLTLTPGVYNDPSSFAITGTLTLDATNNPKAVWIFQAGSTLTTASSSKVVLTNGARAGNIFWQVGSSATLGTDSDFVGNILALTAITANTGATVNGRLLAENAAVTLDSNTITGPNPVTLLSAPVVTGPYTVAAGQSVDLATQTITVPVSGGMQFYLITSATAVTFTSIILSGGNVVMTYN